MEESPPPPVLTQQLISDGDELEVVPSLLPHLLRMESLRAEWVEGVEELRTAPAEQKRGVGVHTAPWDAMESARAMQMQAGLLHIPPNAAEALNEALRLGPAWQAEAREALLMSVTKQLPPTAGALLGRSEVHISPEFEQLKLAMMRQEMLPSLDDPRVNAPPPEPVGSGMATTFLHAVEEAF